MNAFATAMAALVADTNMAEAVTYYAGGAGPGKALRAIRSTSIEPISLGSIGSLRGKQLLHVQSADLPDQPKPGDVLVIGEMSYGIESVEADDLRLTWRITLSE